MEQEKFNIDIDPQTAEGTYSNCAIIAHSSSEFVFDFIRIMPGVDKACVKSRVILSPEHAKRLLISLSENIKKYESDFDNIPIYDMAPSMDHSSHKINIPSKGEA